MQQPKLSIVVPVYKSEKYIKRCVDSLLSQTLDNIEIICVNDGSPDKSLDILNDYKEKYDNIIVIDKKNAGVWKARMDGIKRATGEYIGFLDSDDYVDKTYAQKMYESVKEKNSDIAICGFKRIEEESNKVLSVEMKWPENRKIEMDKNPEEIISINTALWNKIYRASILKELKEIENPPRILEDMMFLTLVYLKTKNISFVDESLYNYMVIQGSAMNTLKESDIDSIKKSMLEVKEEYIKVSASEEMHEILSSIAFLHLGVSLMLSVFKNNRDNFKNEYKGTKEYLNRNFPKWKNTKYTNILYNLTHGKYNLKIAIVRKTYTFNVFGIFLSVYGFITRTLKIDIKW